MTQFNIIYRSIHIISYYNIYYYDDIFKKGTGPQLCLLPIFTVHITLHLHLCPVRKVISTQPCLQKLLLLLYFTYQKFLPHSDHSYNSILYIRVLSSSNYLRVISNAAHACENLFIMLHSFIGLVEYLSWILVQLYLVYILLLTRQPVLIIK